MTQCRRTIIISFIAFTVHLVVGAAAHAQCEFSIALPDEWYPSSFGEERQPRLSNDGDWTAISARGDWGSFGHELFELNSILMFQRVGDEWEFRQSLRDPQEQPPHAVNADFAENFVVKGDRLYVAARDPGEGMLYIYEQDSDAWELVDALAMGDEAEVSEQSDRRIGLAAHADGVIVSALRADQTSFVQWFEETAPGQWEVTQTLEHPDGLDAARFGDFLSIDGDRLALSVSGSSQFDDVLMYEWDGLSWNLDHRLSDTTNGVPSDPVAMKFRDGRLAIATQVDWIYFATVTVFEETEPGLWSSQLLSIPRTIVGDVDTSGFVRQGLDIQGDRIVVTRSKRNASIWNVGAVFFIELIDGSWQLNGAIAPSNNVTSVAMGYPMVHGYATDAALTDDGQLLVASKFSRGHLYVASSPALLSSDMDDPIGTDFDGNGICDHLDILQGADDRDGNLRPDQLEVELGLRDDCDGNGIPDDIDHDCDGNGIPDGCEPDCNDNGIPDPCEADYGFEDPTAQPIMFFVYAPDVSDQLWMRPIEVLPGREMINAITIHRAVHMHDPNAELVILRDVTPDGSLDEAEIILHHPIDLSQGRFGHGLRILTPPTVLGEPGDQVYLGIRVRDGLFRNGYVLFRANEPPSFTDAGVITSASYDGELDLEHPMNSDLFTMLSTQTVAIQAHYGPRAICCADTDITGDDITDVNDLLAVISTWGPCDGCDEDIDEDGQVNVNDLLHILAQWGDCRG